MTSLLTSFTDLITWSTETRLVDSIINERASDWRTIRVSPIGGISRTMEDHMEEVDLSEQVDFSGEETDDENARSKVLRVARNAELIEELSSESSQPHVDEQRAACNAQLIGRTMVEKCVCERMVTMDAGEGCSFISVERDESKIKEDFAINYMRENMEELLHITKKVSHPIVSSLKASKASSSPKASKASSSPKASKASSSAKVNRVIQVLKTEKPIQRYALVNAIIAHKTVLKDYETWINDKTLDNAGFVVKASEKNQQVSELLDKLSHLVVCQTVEIFTSVNGISREQLFDNNGETYNVPFSRSFFYEAKSYLRCLLVQM
jgi:hypothetical protein